jgi:hypothetical protein
MSTDTRSWHVNLDKELPDRHGFAKGLSLNNEVDALCFGSLFES